MTTIWSSQHLPKFSRIRSTKSQTKFDYIQLSRLWLKIGHIQSTWFRPTNLVESTLTKIWLMRPWSKCGHIWPSRLWPKFGRIRQNRPWPKFSQIQSSRSRLKFCQVDLDWNFVKSTLAQIWSRCPRPKFVWKSSKFIPSSNKSFSKSIVVYKKDIQLIWEIVVDNIKKYISNSPNCRVRKLEQFLIQKQARKTTNPKPRENSRYT